MKLAGMKLHAPGVVLLVVMAVDTLALNLFATQHVVDHDLLVVVLQTALVQCQLLIGHIAGRDESVTDICIDAVGGNGDMERLIALPGITAAGKDLDIDQ